MQLPAHLRKASFSRATFCNPYLMMIDPRYRFCPLGGGGYLGEFEDPKTEAHCNVFDWDQLRMVMLKGTAKLFPPYDNNESTVLAQFADCLAPEVRSVSVDDNGLLLGVSVDQEEDPTRFIGYPLFTATQSLANCSTVQYSKLQELDRLSGGTDLVLYEDEYGNPQKAVFKFNPIGQEMSIKTAWDELHVLQSLPPHPNILPLDRVVLEDVEGRIIGFTTKFIPGESLDNSKVPFRFEWLQQLTQLVDFLNLELGIMHQDIAPRNILIDPDTQNLLLIDFNLVACGEKGMCNGQGDVTGVVITLYELITNDKHYSGIPPNERNMDMAQSLSEWSCNRELDSDVLKFRNFLNEWVATRNTDVDGDMERYLNAPNRLTWPELPTPPEYDVPYQRGFTADGKPFMLTGPRSARIAIANGQYVFDWQRPPQSKLKKAENGAQEQ